MSNEDDSDEEGPMHSVTVKPTAKPPKPEKQVVPPLPAKVILVGLQSEQAKHLNEREALCVRFYHERPELNRYVVEIEGVGNKSLALSNLKFIEPGVFSAAIADEPSSGETIVVIVTFLICYV